MQQQGGATINPQTRSVFVLMPFDDNFDDVYLVIRDAVASAAASLGITIRCLRADEIAAPGRITEQIIAAIESADLVIVDLSGNNPNVMYELGYAHALKKPSIIINQQVHSAPFDVKDFRQVLYDRTRLMKDCRPSLLAALKDVFSEASSSSELDDQAASLPKEAGVLAEANDSKPPLRPGPQLVADLLRLRIKLQYAVAKKTPGESRAVAKEIIDLLSRVTVASTWDHEAINNTAANAGNCAVQMEKAELYEEAETAYRRSIGLFPDYAGIHIQYADMLADAKRLEEATAEMERARTLECDDHDRNRLKALEMKISLARGADSPEIAAKLQGDFANNPGDKAAAVSLLVYLARKGAPLSDFETVCAKWKEAAPSAEKWIADRSLADRLADERKDLPATERAIGIYEMLLDAAIGDVGDRPDVLHNLALLYDRIGNHDKARIAWVEAYRIKPNDPQIGSAFSQRLVKWGELDAAVAVSEGRPLPE